MRTHNRTMVYIVKNAIIPVHTSATPDPDTPSTQGVYVQIAPDKYCKEVPRFTYFLVTPQHKQIAEPSRRDIPNRRKPDEFTRSDHNNYRSIAAEAFYKWNGRYWDKVEGGLPQELHPCIPDIIFLTKARGSNVPVEDIQRLDGKLRTRWIPIDQWNCECSYFKPMQERAKAAKVNRKEPAKQARKDCGIWRGRIRKFDRLSYFLTGHLAYIDADKLTLALGAIAAMGQAATQLREYLDGVDPTVISNMDELAAFRKNAQPMLEMWKSTMDNAYNPANAIADAIRRTLKDEADLDAA